MIKIAVAVFVSFIITAHAFAPRGYRWTSETVSRLADSRHPHAWIIRAGMIIYGVILIISTSEITIVRILIAAYGFGVVLSGIFCVEKHERIHIFSIYTAGAGLTSAMFLLALRGDIVSIICLIVLLTAELLFNIKTLSLLRGLSQRIVHLSTLIWLISFQ